MPYYSSVRAINEDAFKATYNTLGGEHVWFIEEHDAGHHRVRRAKTVKGDLYVYVVGREKPFGPIAWGQISRGRLA